MQAVISYLLNTILPIIQKWISPDSENQNWFNEEQDERVIDKYPEPPTKPKKPKEIKFHSPVEMKEPFVTSPYGYRVLKIKGAKRRFHFGLDLRAYEGTEAFAVEDCIVTRIVKLKPGAPCQFRKDKKTGKWIDLKNGSVTPLVEYQGKHTGNIYIHKHTKPNSQLMIGDVLWAGAIIGLYGNYGYSNGSHLHFETWIWLTKVFGLVKRKKGKHGLVNPRVWLERKAKIKCVGRKRKVKYDLEELS
jgi:murein DD-endopeptidase MepM/ murein hydrolase activator NlpD